MYRNDRNVQTKHGLRWIVVTFFVFNPLVDKGLYFRKSLVFSWFAIPSPHCVVRGALKVRSKNDPETGPQGMGPLFQDLSSNFGGGQLNNQNSIQTPLGGTPLGPRFGSPVSSWDPVPCRGRYVGERERGGVGERERGWGVRVRGEG